ncbi:MAG: hypothetical protein AAGM45_12185, partial [Cyanobacteria bacterium J06588_5]
DRRATRWSDHPYSERIFAAFQPPRLSPHRLKTNITHHQQALAQAAPLVIHLEGYSTPLYSKNQVLYSGPRE